MSLVALPELPPDYQQPLLCSRSVARRMLCNGCFVPVPILMPRLPGRSEVFGGGGVCLVVVVVREGLEKRENRWREVVKTAPYPLLSCFLSVSSSTPPMLPKVGKEIKAGRHERHP